VGRLNEPENARTEWAGPVAITWHPDRQLIQLAAWRGDKLTNVFTLHYHHLQTNPLAVRLLRKALDHVEEACGGE